MGWQWHQLNHMQIICTSLQTDNHASTSSLNFYRTDALPDAKPTVSKHCTSASIPLSQVVRKRPRGLLQSLGGRSDTLTARWWSCLESERATWPKKRSLLVLMILETGGQPVVSLTEAFVTCRVYKIQKNFSERPRVKGIQSLSKRLMYICV